MIGKTVNIVGVDPGTYTTGVCILTMEKYTIVKIHTELIDVSDIDVTMSRIHPLAIRCYTIGERFKLILKFIEPIIVGIESGFINRFRPAAYGALSAVKQELIRSVISTDPYIIVGEVSPKYAKKIIGVEDINRKEAVLETLLENVEVTERIDLNKISEHEVDAIAIAMTMLYQYKQNKGLI